MAKTNPYTCPIISVPPVIFRQDTEEPFDIATICRPYTVTEKLLVEDRFRGEDNVSYDIKETTTSLTLERAFLGINIHRQVHVLTEISYDNQLNRQSYLVNERECYLTFKHIDVKRNKPVKVPAKKLFINRPVVIYEYMCVGKVALQCNAIICYAHSHYVAYLKFGDVWVFHNDVAQETLVTIGSFAEVQIYGNKNGFSPFTTGTFILYGGSKHTSKNTSKKTSKHVSFVPNLRTEEVKMITQRKYKYATEYKGSTWEGALPYIIELLPSVQVFYEKDCKINFKKVLDSSSTKAKLKKSKLELGVYTPAYIRSSDNQEHLIHILYLTHTNNRVNSRIIKQCIQMLNNLGFMTTEVQKLSKAKALSNWETILFNTYELDPELSTSTMGITIGNPWQQYRMID